MLFVEVNPRKYKAVQFNKLGDVTGVSRGYIQTKPGGTYYFISEACPRAMDCRFAYIVSTHSGLEEVKEGDWVLTDIKNGKVKIVSNKKFLKDYVGYHGDNNGIQNTESPDPSGFLGYSGDNLTAQSIKTRAMP